MTEEFKIYRSTNKTKMPDDGLIEYETARLKVSGNDFGIIHLSEIQRWMAISPAVQVEFFRSEKEAYKMVDEWKERMKNILVAKFERNEIQKCPEVPKEFTDFLNKLKTSIPSRHPGRLPTISILDPEGGIWVSSWARSISAIQPIFIRGVHFDSDPPVLQFQVPEGTVDEYVPSQDAATHALMYAGLEDLGAVMSVPVRCFEKGSPDMASDGDIPINDLSFGDHILGSIIDEGMWKDRDNSPFVIALGSTNTIALARQVVQLEDLFESDFFVRFDH